VDEAAWIVGVYTFRVATTVNGVPVSVVVPLTAVGVKVRVTDGTLEAAAHVLMVKLKFTGTVVELTVCAAGAAARGLPFGNVGVTV